VTTHDLARTSAVRPERFVLDQLGASGPVGQAARTGPFRNALGMGGASGYQVMTTVEDRQLLSPVVLSYN
jgi:hypothetical protein